MVSSSSFHILRGESSFIVPQEGKGSGILGKIIAVWNTICDLITGIGNRSDVMGNQGRQLRSSQVIDYLTNLKNEEEKFDYLPAFASWDFHGDEADMTTIMEAVEKFDHNENVSKLAIPLILPPSSFLEEKHMVIIFIDKNKNTIDYFDAKGITSDHRQLIAGGSMRQKVLEPIIAKLTSSPSVQVNENARIIQWDCHHCGAYVSWFAQQRLTKDAEQIIQAGINLPGIHRFRKEMKPQTPAPILPSGRPILPLPEEEFS